MDPLMLATDASGKLLVYSNFKKPPLKKFKKTLLVLSEKIKNSNTIFLLKMSDFNLISTGFKLPYEFLIMENIHNINIFDKVKRLKFAVESFLSAFIKKNNQNETIINHSKTNINMYYTYLHLLNKYNKEYFELDLLSIPTGTKINPDLHVFDDVRKYFEPRENSEFKGMVKSQDLQSLQEYKIEIERLVKEKYNKDIFIDINYIEDELNKYLEKIKKIYEIPRN